MENLEVMEPVVDNIEKALDIKHIVMSGGGICGFAFYGYLREMEKEGKWKIEEIKSIYGTSVGAVFAVFIALKSYFDWEILDNYLINRPWEELFEFNIGRIIYSIKNIGLLDQNCIREIYKPLFLAIDISLNITIKEFHELTGIDIHIIVSKICDFKNPRNSTFILENMCSKTHGDWKLLDAVYCSACLPILFQPYIIENDYYIDGGLLCNYPLSLCIQDLYGDDKTPNTDEILGLCAAEEQDDSNKIDTLFDYILILLNNMWHKITMKRETIKNQIVVKTPTINIKDIYDTAKNPETRRKYINVYSTDKAFICRKT